MTSTFKSRPGLQTHLRPNVSLRLPEFGNTQTHESRAAAPNLLAAVRNAVRDVDESVLRPVARRDSGLAYQPRTLLALLLYCYAREIFGSADIEHIMRRDAEFRALCRDEFPDAQMLRHFRRVNRLVMQGCLSTVLQTAHSTNGCAHPSGNAEHCAEEALRRLDMAACMDTLDME